MSGIIGKICVNEKELRKAFRKRKKPYEAISVHHGLVESYKRKGWEVIRINKTSTRITKQKDPDELFEDRVWMVFYKLGFSYMNEDRNCRLEFNSYKKQIDVLARDENNIFVVECRSSESDEVINARQALQELIGNRDDIKKSLETQWGRHCGRINLVVVISSKDKRQDDIKYVNDKKDANINIIFWSEKDLKYLETLISQIKATAKYQLYSVIFANKRQKGLKKDHPALKSKMSGNVFYSFMISAKELLNYAYIHHRKLTGIVEASQAYQRMLKSSRLDKIAKFVDDEDGYFPNSIIVNFTKPLKWKKKEVIGDVEIGSVTLPEYYGCAWIIDGQHRLYGVATSKKDLVVPVLAFEGIEQKDQANLFVDINEKQKKVRAELLWDLYSDIYRDSQDEKQKFLYQIAETAKIMAFSGPLKDIIDIPSIPIERPIKLSLTTVCSTIQKYLSWDHIKHPTNDSKTSENVARIINFYFEVLKSLWPEDWAKGNDGVLLTNNGFGVFIMIFNDIVKHIVYKEKQALLHVSKKRDFEELLKNKYLTPVIESLKIDEETQRNIRSQTGRGPQSNNAGLLEIEIQAFIPDFTSPRIEDRPSIPSTKKPQAISIIENKACRAEGILRKFVLLRLKQNYGSDKWWKLGLTGKAKQDADDKWQVEVTRKPQLREEENPNEFKFNYLGLGHMIDIIIYGNNWDQIFAPIFIKKGNVRRRIEDIMTLRNPSSHNRRIDDQDIIDGMGGLLWLSTVLVIQELNPYS